MKTKKLIQLMIVPICIFCMTISPMSVLAVDCSQLEAIESDNPENIEAIEGTTKVTEETTEVTGEATEVIEEITEVTEETTEVTEDIVEVGDEEKLTSENASIEIESGTEDAPDGLDSSEPARMFLEESDSDDEIDITKYAGGIVIDRSNLSEYNGKIITGTAQVGANLTVKGVEVELTIRDLTIDRAQEGSNNVNCDAIDLQDGATLELTLEGSNKLAGNNSYGGAGICVEDNNKLIITENSSGTLEAVGGDGHGGAAGIGAGNCGYNYNGQEPDRMPALGTIEIRGGTINACGGITREMGNIVMGCAGIGCSGYGKCDTGSIIICGGNVTATGGYGGAGIGGGTDCYPKEITISGGEITANAGNSAAAIGTGYNLGNDKKSCGNISITGGRITANGNIGYGLWFFGEGGFEGGSVAISGDAVVKVANGEITLKDDVEPGHVMQKYPLTVTVKNPSYTAGTVGGHITIGEGSNAFSEDIIFNLEEGKAVAIVEIETPLSGEQIVRISIESTVLEDKMLELGTETDLIYGSGVHDFSVSVSDDIDCHYTNGVLTIGGNGDVTVSMADGVESTTDSIMVDDGADMELTLNRLTVDTTGKGRSPITIGKNGSATCKIIAVGKNTLTRCDEKLAVGVIEATDGSSLTIGGTGTIYIKGKSGSEKDKTKCEFYAGGIRALNASVIIEDNPTLVISNPYGTRFSGILSKNITINGGKINSIVDGGSQGIGIPCDNSTSYDVNINAGTVYVEGGELASWLGAITNKYCQRAVISGGNVNMNKLDTTGNTDIEALEKNHPVNNENELLYCTTITVGKADDNGKNTLSRNAKVTSLTVKDKDGYDYTYGIAGMCTDDKAELYLWLPVNSVVSQVVTDNGTYEGTCTTNTDHTTGYKGNSFGTAKATFALANESEYKVVLVGEGSIEEPYQIGSIEELEKFRELVNNGETEICGILLNNIESKNKEWTPIGTEEHPYQGTFDGNGKKLTSLKISAKDSDYNNKGFFGVVNNAYIKDLEITGTIGENANTNKNAENYGMIAGKASNSTFDGCINSGSVYGGQNAAGICGWASQCTFKKCTNNGNGITISSYKSVCGIVYDGDGSCIVENCMNSMYSNSQFEKMDSSASMSESYTIGGKTRINCLSLSARYDLYEFMEEDANYYGQSRAIKDYACYNEDGIKLTDNWCDGKIAYMLQGDQKELIWIDPIVSNKNEWPRIMYSSEYSYYRVYEIKTYTKCDMSDEPTVVYQNDKPEETLIVPPHVFTRMAKNEAALKSAGNCQQETVYYYSCENCETVEKDDSHTFIGDKGDHVPSEWKYDESEHWKECIIEGCGIEIPGSREAHSFGEKIKKEATDDEKGEKLLTCIKCGITRNEEFDYIDPDEPDRPDAPDFKAHSFKEDDVCVKFTKVTNASMEYTGNYLMPTVSVTYKAKGSKKAVTLKENVDYKLSYVRNKNVGTAKARVYGIGDFGSSKDLPFEITARDIASKKAKISIAALPEIVFTNEAEVLKKLADAINVAYNGKELVSGIDYDVEKVDALTNPSVRKGVNLKAKITGSGNYKGSKEFKFKLLPSDSVKGDISTDYKVEIKNNKTSVVYTGKLIKPSVVVKNASGKKLSSSNYKVSYYNNLNVGTAKIKVFGTKGYIGAVETNFTIIPKDINKCKITVKNSNLLYTGFDQKKNVSLTVKDGSNILRKGVDYVVEYSGDWKGLTGKTDKPTIQIKATAGGNYMNNDAAKKKLTKTFKISKAKLNSSVSVKTTLMLNGTELDKGTGKDESKYVIPKDNYEAFKNGTDNNIVVKYNGMKLNGIVSGKRVDTTGKEYTIKIKETKKNKEVTGGTITLTGVNSFTGNRTIKYLVE